jgi:gas vesicle protein
MKTQNEEVNIKVHRGPLSRLTWLFAGVGIGAIAGILLAPQSGEDTREWISTKCKNGIDNVNSKVRNTGRQVGGWTDQKQHQVSEAISAGRDAFNEAKAAS